MSFEVIGKTRKGIEIENKQAIYRASHNDLINSLTWIKGPIFLLVKNQIVGMEMFWLSSYLESDILKIIPLLKGDELDIELSKFDTRVLHIGPVFVSLHWVTSSIEELKEGKMTADFPLLGATIRYEADLPRKEVMNVHKAIMPFFEQSLKRRGFNGACFWGFINGRVMISPNMFYFARTKKLVCGNTVYNGEELTHLFYFELGDVLESEAKPKYITFFKLPGKERIRYDIRKMKLSFEIFNRNAKAVESTTIPISDFTLSMRHNAFNFFPECFKDVIV